MQDPNMRGMISRQRNSAAKEKQRVGNSDVAAVIRRHMRMLSANFWRYHGIRRILSAFLKI